MTLCQRYIRGYLQISKLRMQMVGYLWDRLAIKFFEKKVNRSLTKELQINKKVFASPTTRTDPRKHQRRSSAPSVMQEQISGSRSSSRGPRRRGSVFSFLPQKAISHMIRQEKFALPRVHDFHEAASKYSVPRIGSLSQAVSNASAMYILTTFVTATTARKPTAQSKPAFLQPSQSAPELQAKRRDSEFRRQSNTHQRYRRHGDIQSARIEYRLTSALFERIGRRNKQSRMFLRLTEELQKHCTLPTHIGSWTTYGDLVREYFRHRPSKKDSLEARLYHLPWSMHPVLPSPLLKYVAIDFLLRMARRDFISVNANWKNRLLQQEKLLSVSLEDTRSLMTSERSKCDRFLKDKYTNVSARMKAPTLLLFVRLKEIWNRTSAETLFAWIQQFETTVRTSVWNGKENGVFSEQTLAAERRRIFASIRQRKEGSEAKRSVHQCVQFLLDPFIRISMVLAQEAWQGFTTDPDIDIR